MSHPTIDLPLACQPFALRPDERARSLALRETLTAATQAVRALPDGCAFTLAPASLPAALEWLELERRCCPFLDFVLTWRAGAAAPELALTGPPGARHFLSAELPALTARS